ncbi:MAG: hypothetical protein Q8S84_02100 [bacterium]|nr:hypothetical protein [bacterium]
MYQLVRNHTFIFMLHNSVKIYLISGCKNGSQVIHNARLSV